MAFGDGKGLNCITKKHPFRITGFFMLVKIRLANEASSCFWDSSEHPPTISGIARHTDFEYLSSATPISCNIILLRAQELLQD